MTHGFAIITAILIAISTQNIVHACVCGNWPSPCEAYASATAVFIGYVSRVEPDSADRENMFTDEQTAYVKVEKSFKGLRESSEIVLHQPDHDCAPKFTPKKRYLMYAHYHDKEKTWEVFGCGRSDSIEDAGDDLLYLNRLPESATKTRISGTIKHYEKTPENGFSKIKNIVGLKVKIIGREKTYEVYTDQNGVYEIIDLLPDKYGIEPDIPFGLKIDFPMPFGSAVEYSDKGLLKVSLWPRSCAGSDFVLTSDSSISGKVLDANGELMPRVCLDLLPANKPANHHFSISGCTEKDGRYEMKEIPPGKYLIVANNDGVINGDTPFEPVYYPGVFEKEKGKVITIREAEKLQNIDLRIPSQLPINVIEGVLLYADGLPAGDEFVDFTGEGASRKFESKASAATDEHGHFSMRLLQGSVGWLHGFIYVYFGKYPSCVQADTLLTGKAGESIKVETESINIQVNNDIKNVKLVLPFASCPKDVSNEK